MVTSGSLSHGEGCDTDALLNIVDIYLFCIDFEFCFYVYISHKLL